MGKKTKQYMPYGKSFFVIGNNLIERENLKSLGIR